MDWYDELLAECETPEDFEEAMDYALECVMQTEYQSHDPEFGSRSRDHHVRRWLEEAGGGFEGDPAPEWTMWQEVKDGNDGLRAIYERHYSAKKNLARRRKRGAKLCVGPGEKLCLIIPSPTGGAEDPLAGFAWRREYIRKDFQMGINCSFFRHESWRWPDGCAPKASTLLAQAEAFARARWPLETRFYTYIDPRHVKPVRSRKPSLAGCGYSYKKAGWRECGTSKKGLIRLEKVFMSARMMDAWSQW